MHLRKSYVGAGTGEYATKFALILLICCVALYRCRNECPSDLFLEIEEQIYKVKKYLLLAAATGATTSLAVAALITPFSIPLQPPPVPPSSRQSTGKTSGGTSSVTSSVTSGVTGPPPRDSTPPSGGGSTSEGQASRDGATAGHDANSSSVEQHASGSARARPSAVTSGGGDQVLSGDVESSQGIARGSTPGQAGPAAVAGGEGGEEPASAQTGRHGSNAAKEEEAFRWSCLLGTLTNGVAEALGLDQVLDRQPYRTAVVTVLLVNMVVMPLVVVYVLWPLWIPQLPALRIFIDGPLWLVGRRVS